MEPMRFLPNKQVFQSADVRAGYDRFCPDCGSHTYAVVSTSKYTGLMCLSANQCEPTFMTFYPQIKYVFKLFFYTLLLNKHTPKWRAARKDRRHAALWALRSINECELRKLIIVKANLW